MRELAGGMMSKEKQLASVVSIARKRVQFLGMRNTTRLTEQEKEDLATEYELEKGRLFVAERNLREYLIMSDA